MKEINEDHLLDSNIRSSNTSKSYIEIDLLQLFKEIWRGKLSIVCFVFLGIVGSTIYLSISPSWWTSTAIITNPRYQDNIEIQNQLTNVYSVIENDEFSEIISNEALLNIYVKEFNTYNNKKDFIDNDDFFQKLRKEKVTDEESEVRFVNFWVNKIKVIKVKSERNDKYKLTFQSTSPLNSKELLVRYDKHIESYVNNEVYNNILAFIQSHEQLQKAELNKLEGNAEQYLKKEQQKTIYALAIAKVVKATGPIGEMANNEQLFPIGLGSEGLKEQVKILSEINDLSLFIPEISEVKVKLELLNNIKLNRLKSVSSIRYLKNADLPLIQDYPNKLRVSFFGMIFGFVLGVIFVVYKNNFLIKKLV